MSHDVFDISIKPLIEKKKKLVFIIIDCFKMDQWKKISFEKINNAASLLYKKSEEVLQKDKNLVEMI